MGDKSDLSSISKRISILKSFNIFNESSELVLNEIALTLKELNIKAGQIVFNKGDQLDGMYLIASGQVKVHDDNYVFAQLKEFEFFGEYSLIDSDVRSASVTALTDSKLFKLDHDTLSKILNNEIKINIGLLKSLIKRLRENNVLEEQLVKQKEEIEAQQLELKQLNATKDKFFAILAHDLRNPLSTIFSVADTLQNNYDTLTKDQQKNFIASLKTYSNNALQLLNELMQWARSKSGMGKYEPQPINIKKLFDESFKPCLDDANNKNIEVSLNINESCFVSADLNMTITIIRNLFNNATKFTPENGIIKIYSNATDKNIEIYIEDNGLGISKEDQKKLFRIEEDSSKIGINDHKEILKEQKGTGLGLILCKELAIKNEGDIKVESEIGKGSKFILTLPKI